MKLNRVLWLALAVLVAGLDALPARAHGGQYAGPGTVDLPPTRRPDRGGQRVAKPGVPAFAQNGPTFEPARWECWWAMNREDFLVPGATIASPDGGTMAAAVPLTREDVRKRVVPILLKALKDKNPEVRSAAAIALGKAGDGNDLDAVIQALADHDRIVSEGAIIGLGLFRDPRAEAPLAAVLNGGERNARERGMAAIALGFSGGALAQTTLLEPLGAARARPPAAPVSTFAAVEAARFIAAGLWAGADRKDGSPDRTAMVAALLQRALAEPAALDRFDAAFGTAALAKVRDPGSLAFVLKVLGDPRSDVRAAAALAAGRVIRKDDAKSVQALTKVMTDEGDIYARHMMMIALGRIGGPDAIKTLKARFDQQDRQDRSFAAIALGIAGAADAAALFRKEFEAGSDESLRGALAVALGLLGDKAALPTMLDVIRQKRSPELSAHVMWYFALLRERASVPTIMKVLTDSKAADLQCASAFALGCMGDQTVRPQLVRLISEGGSTVIKGSAATAIGRIGDPLSVDLLIKIFENDHEQDLSRAYAIVALGNLGRRSPWNDLPRVAIDSLYDLRCDALDEVKDLL